MAFECRTGKIKMLRVNDLGHVWGSPNDALNTETVIQLDTTPDMGFGFELRNGDDNLPARLAMLSTLKDAYFHQVDIAIWYDIVEGKKTGHLRRVQLG